MTTPSVSPVQHRAVTHMRMPLAGALTRPENAVLNDINAEIFGKRVWVNALLDTKGLDKLKLKIEALQSLISDDDESETPHEDSDLNRDATSDAVLCSKYTSTDIGYRR